MKKFEKYKNLFENLTCGCAVYRVINDGKYGKDYIIEDFNKKSLELENKTLEEVVGKSLFDLRPKIDDYGLIDVFREVWKTGKPANHSVKIYVDDKYSNYYENRVFKLEDNVIVALYNDVTDHIQLQKELIYSNAQLESYFDLSPYGIFVADENGNYVYVNKQACKITGYSENELLGWNILNLISDEDKNIAQKSFNNVKNKNSDRTTVIYRTKNGEKKHWTVNAAKISANRYIGFVEDVTEQKKLEKKLDYERNRAIDYFETANVIFVVLDKEGCVKNINEKGCEILGYKHEDILGKNWFDNFIPQSKIKEVKRVFGEIACGQIDNIKYYENPIITSKGKIRFISWHNSIAMNELDEIDFILSAGIDITEQKKSESKLLESEEKHKIVFEKSPVPKSITYLSGEMHVNEAFCRMTGYTKEELLRGRWKNITHPDDVEKSQKVVDELLSGEKERARFQKRYISKDGSILWIDLQTTINRDNEGNPLYLISVFNDITEKLQTEQKLIESERNFRDLFDFAPIPYQSLDQFGNILFVNQTWADLLGYDKNEVTGKYLGDFMTEDSSKQFAINFNKFEKSGKACKAVYNMKTKNNKILIINIKGNIVFDDERKFKQTYCVLQDMTHTIKMERKLRESEARYKSLFENSGIELKYLTPDGKIIAINKKSLEYIEGKPECYIGKSIFELFPKEEANLYMERIKNAISNDEPQLYETQVVTPNALKWYSSTYSRILGDDGKVLGVQIASIDITDRKDVESKLKRSELRYRTLVENSPVCTKILDKNSNLIYMSDAGVTMLKIDDVNGHYNRPYPFYFFPESFKSDMTEHIELSKTTKEVISFEGTACDIKREAVSLHSIIVPITDEAGEIDYMMVVSVNTTKRVMAEKEKAVLESHLRNQQRLESIGTLASGVAHEINNPINGILNYGQIILDSDVEYNDIKEYAGEIIHETQRVSEIVKNLLDFSRQNKEEHSYSTIEDIIFRTLSLIKTVLRHDQIELNMYIDKDIPKIKCRSQQIQQVIMNLFTNARSALNEKYPQYDANKKINLSCASYDSDERRWIRLVVEDFGTGIPKDIINNIFDPFFTTKERSEGTGLGLSISYGIVKEHHGKITAESEEGKFTRFIVDLPCDNGWELK